MARKNRAHRHPVSTCSFNVSTLTDLLPSVITSVVHDHAAPVAQYLGAIDTLNHVVHSLDASQVMGRGSQVV